MGLNAARTRRIRSRSASVNISGINSLFSMPTPCSPVSAPPISTQNFMISPAAAMALVKLRGIALVKKNQWVEVTVARVKYVADLQPVALPYFGDVLQSDGQFRARNYAIHDVVGGRQAANRSEGVFAALPQQFAFSPIRCPAHFTRMMQAADIGDLRRLRFRGFAHALDFDEQHRGAIERETGVHESLDGAQRPRIEHLARCGSDTARSDVGHRVGGVFHRIENGQQRAYFFRQS